MLDVESVMSKEIRATKQVIYKNYFYFYVMDRFKDASCIVGYKERLAVESVMSKEIRATKQVMYKRYLYFYIMKRFRITSCIVGYNRI